jgi:hypothetical protein
MESTAAKFTAAAAKFTAPETAITESASHATMKAAASETTTTTEAATAKAATMETATAHAAAVETATATTKAAAAHAATAAVATATAASTAAATRQRHCWRSQANGRNCQQRDNRLAQHHHSPSEISLPAATLFAGGNRFGKSLLDSTSPVLNSPRATADRILIRVRVAASLKQSLCCRCNLIWIFVTKKLLFGQRIESELT